MLASLCAHYHSTASPLRRWSPVVFSVDCIKMVQMRDWLDGNGAAYSNKSEQSGGRKGNVGGGVVKGGTSRGGDEGLQNKQMTVSTYRMPKWNANSVLRQQSVAMHSFAAHICEQMCESGDAGGRGWKKQHRFALLENLQIAALSLALRIDSDAYGHSI